MTAATSAPPHPVPRALGDASAALAGLADIPLWSMRPAELADALTEVGRLKSQVTALELRLAAQADRTEVGRHVGATSTASWWAHATRQTPSRAHGLVRLGAALDGDREPVGRALAAGRISLEQAEVVVAALDALPEKLDPKIAAAAEAELLRLAATDHDPRMLRIAGRHILTLVAPQIGEAHDAQVAEREHREATAAARLILVDDRHGTTHLRGQVPTHVGAMLKKALLALAAPKHRAALHGTSTPGGTGGVPGGGARPPGPERLGRALCEYVERYPTDRLPKAGGLAATVVVTMSVDTLRGGLAPARLDTGEVIPASLARRLACEAGIIPAVLGGDSQVLDLGRKRRLHTPAMRAALALRDRGCTAEGCDWPPGLCHAHHDTPWSHGGDTSLANGRLLCPRHHARAHDPAYTSTRLAGGRIAFHRRT